MSDFPQSSVRANPSKPSPVDLKWPTIPAFRAHPLVPGAHLQTVVPYYRRQKCPAYSAVRHTVDLPDGDRLVLHDDCPDGWHEGGRVALLLHGLTGCHMSGYMERCAFKLSRAGVRVFRLDLRSCGAGAGLARLPYHAGMTEDVHESVAVITRLCGASPLALVGFSLSGNMVLKLLGEAPRGVPATVDRAMAVNPPVDLAACMRRMKQGLSRFYDRFFGRKLAEHYQSIRGNPDTDSLPRLSELPKGIREFDMAVTAPIHGFGTVENYYASASSAQFVGEIRVPTLVISSSDDPMLSISAIEQCEFSRWVKLHITDGGGHLGYTSRRGQDADNRWIDWRVLDWVTFGSKHGSSTT
ncbi:MAG: alpha/beta fold hydrolase [Planctomycetota bacterium]|nr:alpha/beta fold hydrolase [Planctomycetota bacterium]